ncbi:DUF2834 domain-containing protein [Lusitaniella coriacea]|uniref:DUF2834 domain-containing protein n=1 Tax=Lusitaniella coriacea TaxID=1983105 RepID=UPI003CF9BBDF
MKYFYGILCILGTVLPYSQFIPWLAEHGFDLIQLVQDAARLKIGAFAWLDVLVSALALLGWIITDARSLGKKMWLPVVGTLTVGVSLGLPLFLLLREFDREPLN